MDYCIFLSIFTSALSTFSVKQQPFSVLEFTAFELLSWCGYKRPFYRYGGHIELIRFKEYYRVPKGHEQDLIYSLCIYARFSGQFFFTSFLEKGCNGKKKRCAMFECNNDCLFPKKYTMKFSFCPKSARKYWASAPLAFHNTPYI